MSTKYEYVTDKYGQGGGDLDWYDSVEQFERIMADAGMPCKLTMCGLRNGGWGYRDEEGELVLIEHEPD